MKSGHEAKGPVAIGCDHAGYRLKLQLVGELEDMGYRVKDMGTGSEESCDYPDFALLVAEAVMRGEVDAGVLVCGTGTGMAMVANKVPGVRAAACADENVAEYSRRHNDANVIALGARLLEPLEAVETLRVFLGTGFEGGGEAGRRHARRLEKLKAVEEKYRCMQEGF